MMPTLPYYQDFNSDIGPGAGAQPATGLTSNNAITAASGGLTNSVPGQSNDMNDVLRQLTDLGPAGSSDIGPGNAQGGSVGDRLAGAARAGFADPTLGNIARSAMFAAGMMGPMGPLDVAAGALIDGLHLPGYASPIMGIAGQLAGVPLSPDAPPSLTGWGNYPPELLNALSTATTPAQIAAIQAQLQAYQAQHGTAANTHDFSAGIDSSTPGGLGGMVGGSIPGSENPGEAILSGLRDALAQGGIGGGNAGGAPSTGGGIGGGPGGSHASVAGF